jgi:hypothetical protein
MAVGNIIYSSSSTTIVSGAGIRASNFERSTNLQVDDTSGNLNIAGGINTGGTSNLGSVGSVKITGGSSGQLLRTDGSGNLNWSSTLGSVSDIKISGGSSGQVLSTDGSSNLSWINTGPVYLGLQSTTSGSIVSFTGIPSWARRITVMFREISTSTVGGSLQIQLGTSSGYETSDYYGAFGYSNSGGGAGAGAWSSAMVVGAGDGASGITYNGSIILTRLSPSSNAWTGQSIVSERIGETLLWTGAGSKSLAGTLDRISVSTTGGTFTAGSVNVMYE